MDIENYTERAEWRDRELVYVGNINSGVSRVLGFSDGSGGHESIPLKHQRNCRAFLRKYSGLVSGKIIFDGPSCE